MGRKPIGERAMTDAERQRRRREALKAQQPPKPVRPAGDGADAKAQAEIERLRAKLDRLEADNAQLKAKAAAAGANQAQAEIAALKAAKPQANSSPGADVQALQAEIAALKAERFQMEMKIGGLEGQLYQLRKQQAANAKPKVEKPPLPPDEVRDRQIEKLKAEINKFKAKLPRAAVEVRIVNTLHVDKLPIGTVIDAKFVKEREEVLKQLTQVVFDFKAKKKPKAW